MAISGPQSVIASLRNRLRLFNLVRKHAADQPEGGIPQTPLEEIPGTKASFEKAQQEGPNSHANPGEKKG